MARNCRKDKGCVISQLERAVKLEDKKNIEGVEYSFYKHSQNAITVSNKYWSLTYIRQGKDNWRAHVGSNSFFVAGGELSSILENLFGGKA